ncbi:hypothetical protein IFM89_037758 [Coptis chinensis]|uniref:Uncharacterized protein n=1 Tax=Coptis chinensis TaxID=261450 RepID=A0A835IVS3_9MAGN|nr:hypothetical protein IFM89_037758 [Coptis chinensis]
MPWFQRRHTVAEQEQHRLWRQARLRTEIQQYLLKMSELEIVDYFNLQRFSRMSALVVVCQKLKCDLQAVFKVLPKDMQQLLLFNPQTAALLQGSLEVTKVPGHPSSQVEVVSPHSPR